MKLYMPMLLILLLVASLCACGSKAETAVGEIPEESATALTWQEQYDLGVRYLSEGNYKEAIIAFEAAIKIDPKRVEGYLGLADAYEAMGDSDRAAQVIEDAIAALGELEELLARLEPELVRQGDEPGYMTLLMRQEYLLANGDHGQITYQYDEQGYLLTSEHQLWNYGPDHEFSGTDHAEFSYENGEAFAHRWYAGHDGITQDNGAESLGEAFPGDCAVGVTTGFAGDYSLCMDPCPEEYWLCPARVENPHIQFESDWAYADVTYDDRGYPVAYTSYDTRGQLGGTAELYWEIVPVVEE